MGSQLVWITALAAGLAFTCSYLLTWLARGVAPRLGFVDKPDGRRKVHARVIPLMGGVAVYLGCLIPTLAIGCYVAGHLFESSVIFRTLVSAALFCVLGVIDDKVALRPRTKFLAQILAALPFIVGTHSVDTVAFLGIQLRLGLTGTLFMLFWLVACSNVVNLIDGLDGLASTIGMLAMITIAGLSLIGGNATVALLSLVVGASLFGFLFHNWPPAKIFLGDAGSLTIGFLAGALALEASLKTAAVFTLTAPAVVMSVPAFDTFMAILRRRLTGRNIGEADRGHIHHRLQDRGLTKLQTLLAIGGLSFVMAVSAILATYFDNDLIAAFTCVSVFALVIASRLFGYHETLLVFRHVQALQELFLDSFGLMRTRFLLARAQDGDDQQRRQLWQEACQRLARMGFTSVEVTGSQPNGPRAEFQRRWEAATPSRDAVSKWGIRYEVMRDDGWLFSVSGEGLTLPEDRLPRADDLFRIFHGLCHHLPLEGDELRADVLRFDEVHAAQPAVSTSPTPSQTDSQTQRRAA